MAQIGDMGGIPFAVSSFRVLTFRDYSRSGAPRISTHDLIGRKSTMEFVGKAPEEISMKIKLTSTLGVDPLEMLDKLRQMRDDAEIFPLIIGEGPVSNEFWVITNLSESVNYWTGDGDIISVDVDLSLKEYVL